MAIQWWQNHCILHPGLRLTWEQFKDEVRKRFQPIEASRTARVNLRNLKQGNKSVADYCSAFYEQLQLIHDMSEVRLKLLLLSTFISSTQAASAMTGSISSSSSSSSTSPSSSSSSSSS